MEIGNNTNQAEVVTLNELLEGIENIIRKGQSESSLKPEYPELPPLVTGIKGLANILGISVSTISRMKADGVLDEAILQNGKTVIFDTYKVLDILRISNHKNKFNRKNCKL